MANYPEGLKYSKEHEWVKVDGEMALVGITDFAQSSLGDIVFCELPDEGTELKKDESFGVVESVKSVSDLYAPVNGSVVEKNEELESEPEKINTSPYECWMLKVKISDASELEELMDGPAYKDFCENS